MIFLLWIAFIFLECLTHWFVIEMIQFDLTPDHRKSFSHLIVMGSRFIAYMVLWWSLGVHQNSEFWMFTLGCLFTHLLIFPILLNLMRGMRIHYLGKGFTDNILAILPFQARVWFLLVLSVGMIYGYYNTDLL